MGKMRQERSDGFPDMKRSTPEADCVDESPRPEGLRRSFQVVFEKSAVQLSSAMGQRFPQTCAAHILAIIVPERMLEVRSRKFRSSGHALQSPPPPSAQCVNFPPLKTVLAGLLERFPRAFSRLRWGVQAGLIPCGVSRAVSGTR